MECGGKGKKLEIGRHLGHNWVDNTQAQGWEEGVISRWAWSSGSAVGSWRAT